MRCIRFYLAICFASLFALPAPLAAQALIGNFTSHTDGQIVSNPSVTITWTGCSNTTQSSYQTRVNGSVVSTTQSNGLPCPDYSIGKNYSASATLVSGANSLYLQVCDLSDCGESTITVNYIGVASVSVTPDGATAPSVPHRTSSSYTFKVKNTGGYSATAAFTYSCTGSLGSCSVAPGSAFLAAGDSTTATLSYAGATVGSGQATLTARYNEHPSVTDNGSVNVSVTENPIWGVSVVPLNPSQSVSAGTAQIRFEVANTSQYTSTPSTFDLSAAVTGSVTSCSLSPASVTLYPGDPPNIVTATCTISGSGSGGSVKLTASTSSPASFSADGTTTVTVGPTYNVSLTAVSSKTEPQRTTMGSVDFTITNNSQNSGPILFSFDRSCTGVVTCADPINSVSVAEGASATVNFPYNVSLTGTTGEISLTATSVAPSQTKVVSIFTTPDYAASVTPDASSITVPAGTNTTGFTIQNTSANTPGPVSFTLTATCTGVASCVAAQGTINLAQGASSPKTVSFDVSSSGTDGTVALAASSMSPSVPAVTGTTQVTRSTAAIYRVKVTPSSPSVTLPAQTTRDSSLFTIQNTSSNSGDPITFTLTPSCTGIVVSCTSPIAPVTLWEGASDTRWVTYDVSLIGDTGSVSLEAFSTSPSVPSSKGTTSVSATPRYAIAVIPATGSVTVAAGTTNTYSVAIQNQSTNSANAITVSLPNPSCSEVTVGNCSVLANSAVIGQGAQTSPLTLTYSALSANPTPETIALNATGTVTGGTVQVTNASLSVTVTGAQAGTIAIASRNPGTTVDRRSCLTVAAGQNAAYECGDLRVVHDLPATVTMDRSRGPVLIYNSRHANPGALLAADVTYSGPAPALFKATVTMPGQANIVRDFAWSSACSAKACRIVVPIATTQPTGLYATTLQVSAMNGGTTYATSATVTDSVVIVNRAGSPFGAGWWLDGLESLVSLSTTKMLWVGGDGSARVYTSGSNPDIYTVTPAYDRPDTLKKMPGVQGWRRSMGDSAYVEFTTSGQHAKTVSSLGWETKFVQTGALLDSLVLPVPAGSATVRRYRFWHTSGLLDSVQAPAGSFSRTTRIARGGTSRVNSITDPDGLLTMFGYDAANRITSRRNKLADTTYFDYDGGGTLKQAKLSTARTDGGSSAITTTFRAAETRSIFDTGDLPTPVEQAYTKLDGPRTDVGDTTNILINRWGAPDTVTNAVGQRTRISRGNATFPALVTKVVAPNGFETRAFFNSRALTDSTVAVNPYATGSNAKTTFIWNPLWNRVDSLIDPTGKRTRTFYRASRPLVDSVRTGTNVARRVKFAYTADNQLRSVTEAGGSPDSVLYDALGNATKTWTPLGRSASVQYFTQFFKDAIGRDTLVVHPISGDTTGSTRIMYDVADRVIRTVSSGPARPYTLSLSGFARDTATISALAKTDTSGYDAEGNLTYKRSWSSPSSDAEVNESLAYDAAGRLRKRLIGTGPDSMVYDPAGNLVSARHRSGSWVTQSYDALNRLATRVVPQVVHPRERCTRYSTGPISGPGTSCLMVFPYYPNLGDSLRIRADTARFVYDAVSGDMRQANNRYARVRRTYYPGGALKTDTTVFGLYSSPLVDNIARGQQYVYDLSGRRSSMQWYFGTNTYRYNDFAALDSLIAPHADLYRIKYDLKGQVDSLVLGTGVKEKRVYDDDGRMTSRNRVSTYGTLGTIVSDVFGYDRMNRVISVSEQVAQQGTGQTVISYDGLGAVLAKEQGNAFGARVEEFRNDAFGNVVRRRTRRTAGLINDVPFANQYSPIGELTNSFAQLSSPPGQYEREDQLTQEFAAGGQLLYQDQLVRIPNGDVTLQLAGRHYYGADDRLMAVQLYSYRSTSLRDGTWEEYWYDALGRRILTRARRDPATVYNATFAGPLCIGTNRCRSYTERVWWDGDQALVEERTPEGTSDGSNSGIVRNIHGPTLDEPLSMIADAIRIINYNWRGQGMSSVFLDGQAGDLSLGNAATEVDWPASTQAETYFAASPDAAPSNNPKRWLGTFVANGQGTTGMLYRRNRYFDPKSGQFTQADPIGIAGGMNVFGFADGDPINNSDPFGLSPCCGLSGLGAQTAVADAVSTVKLEHEAMLEYAGQRAESNTMLLVGGLQLGWNILRAGALIARNLPQPSNVAEQLAFKSLLSGPSRTIAGGTSGVAFRDVGRITGAYGGRAADWAKMSSASRWTDRMGRQFETHWVENLKTGVKVEVKFSLLKDVH